MSAQTFYLLNLQGSLLFKKQLMPSAKPAPGCLNPLIAQLKKSNELDPIIETTDAHGSLTYLLNVSNKTCLYALLLSSQANPLVYLETLQFLQEAFTRYIGEPLSSSNLRENFDIVHSILEEVYDGGAIGFVYWNILSLQIPRESRVTKALQMFSASKLVSSWTSTIWDGGGGFLSPTGGTHGSNRLDFGSNSGEGLGSGFSGSGSSVWWRKGGCHYASNSVYIDVIEKLDAVIYRGAPLNVVVSGSICLNAQLSDLPNLTISLRNTGALKTCGFHPCVRLDRFDQDSVLSFVPPDGESIIASYVIQDPSTRPPISLEGSFNFPQKGLNGDFEIRVSQNSLTTESSATSQTNALNDVEVCLLIPKGLEAEALIPSQGRAEYLPAQSMVEWYVGNLSSEKSKIILRGRLSSLNFPNSIFPPRSMCTARVKYQGSGASYSDLKIGSIEISGVDYTIYKACRYLYTTANLEFRFD